MKAKAWNFSITMAMATAFTIVTSLLPYPGYTRSSSGCGDSSIAGRLVPNNPTGGASFKDACNNHDACYSTIGTPKRVCDNNFYNEMLEICRIKYRNKFPLKQRACKLAAKVYYRAVRIRGGDAYRQAQQQR